MPDSLEMSEIATPTKARRGAPAARALALVTAGALALAGAGPAAVPARAQERVTTGLPIIRDTEIENLVRDYAEPILKAAGLEKQHIKVVIINSREFNAFVMDGRHIFINSGALFDCKTPNEVIGIFAHESGHLADGHLMRLREKLAQAQTASVIGMLLGIGALVAGARAGGSGAAIGGAAMSAPQSMVMHSLLAYVRTQEDQADHAGVKFLTMTHQSARGMLDIFKRLAGESLYQTQNADPYLQTHPFPAEREKTLEELARNSPYWNVKDPAALQLRHDLMRAKLSGYLEAPGTVLRRYPPGNQSLPARYARAISTYRHGSLGQALVEIDGLIRSEPTNPYFEELKGQALMDGGRPALALAPLRRAVALSHNAPLIEILLGRAMVATNNKAYAGDAISILSTALRKEPDMSSGYLQLAMAYGRTGDLAHADLASARAAMTRGDIKTARMLAERAKHRFPVGSPAWVQADDIVSVKRPH
jgi:predicted Zn-dependent protease